MSNVHAENYKAPIEPNSVPEKCWEETFIDMFGPLPSSHHVLLVQDLTSRYPVTKIVKSRNAKSVIPVLRDTYGLFGRKQNNFVDNFVCRHPAANKIETVMKPLDKAMKIGNMQNLPETPSAFLTSYRDTPHVLTGVSPAHMLLQDR